MHYKANPSLGGTIRNNFKEWLRTKSGQIVFMEWFFSNIFTTRDLVFCHVYLLHARIYGLKFSLK
jgi:hypothetical protein